MDALQQLMRAGKWIEVAFCGKETRIADGLGGDALDVDRGAGIVDHGPDVEVLELSAVKSPPAQLREQCIDTSRLNPCRPEAFYPLWPERLPRWPLCLWPERSADIDQSGLQVGHRTGW